MHKENVGMGNMLGCDYVRGEFLKENQDVGQVQRKLVTYTHLANLQRRAQIL